ncbi:MAG: hypothetical protein WD926_01390 [Patescibacteria group bacterium]
MPIDTEYLGLAYLKGYRSGELPDEAERATRQYERGMAACKGEFKVEMETIFEFIRLQTTEERLSNITELAPDPQIAEEAFQFLKKAPRRPLAAQLRERRITSVNRMGGVEDEASLVPLRRGFSVLVGSRHSNPVLAFAHELAHTFFFDLSNLERRALGEGTLLGYNKDDQSEETWCESFAYLWTSYPRVARGIQRKWDSAKYVSQVC